MFDVHQLESIMYILMFDPFDVSPPHYSGADCAAWHCTAWIHGGSQRGMTTKQIREILDSFHIIPTVHVNPTSPILPRLKTRQ